MKRPFAAYTGDEPYVFVCYAHDDTDVVYPEIQRLHEAGVRIWYDEGIAPGKRWSDELARALGRAALVLFFCTSRSVKSQHCQDEVNFALDEKRQLLVVQDGEVDLPPGMRLRLGAHQSILKDELSTEQFVDKLTAAISRHVAAEPRAPSKNPVAATRATATRGARWLTIGGITIVSLALVYFVVDKFASSKSVTAVPPVAAVTPVATAISQKSIAVLPFTDMSATKDQEYLADGMAEEIINLLAQVPDLLVPARTSSFNFKGKQTTIPEIARELGVAYVLEGSIRRSDDHLRVTAQLVRADNGYHLWSESYDRELRDVFKVQDVIASAVVQALQIKLAGGELTRQKGGTENLEAYQLYLRAMSALNQNTKGSLDVADAYLEQAIKLDAGYGMAWYALATVVSMQTDNAWLDPTAGWERVRQLAQHALQLSPDLAEAHARLQWVHQSWDWDWPAAEAEGRRALTIDPTNATALMAGGRLAATLGHWDDSERQLRAALVRDPLNPYLIWNLAFTYYRAGRLQESEALYRKLLEVEPGFLWTRSYLGKVLLAQGKPDAALAMVQQEADEATRLWFLPILLQAAGRQAEADEALQAQIAQWANTGAFFVAVTYAYRGEHDHALEWLDRAYRQKDASLDEIIGEPLVKNLADDPRYKAFLRKMRLPES
jgi:TolB-like protein